MEFIFVAAIIGTLSSIIFIFLNHARGKARDAKVKTQLASLRGSAQIYYNEYGNYGTEESDDCSSSFFVDIASSMFEYTSSTNYPAGVVLTCRSDGPAYAVSALLPGAGGSKSWCVDSTGDSKSLDTPTVETYCVATPPYSYEYQYQTPYTYQYQYPTPYTTPYSYQYQYQTPYSYPYPTPCVPEPGSCDAQEGGLQNACGSNSGHDSCGYSCSRSWNNCNSGQSCESGQCVSD